MARDRIVVSRSPAAVALGLVGALALSACNPLPEGPSLLNPPTDTCDLTLQRPEDCTQVKGSFGSGHCTIAPASVCHGPEGTVVVTFLGEGQIRQATVVGRATCRTSHPVPECSSTE